MATESSNSQGESGCDVDFSVLPEGCIANSLSMTSPRDACRLSLVGPAFRSAADSDSVWERFLPSDYQDIIARSADAASITTFASKKELYLHLCDHPLIIDGGTKSFSLEKRSGKKCYMLAARDLSIVWGDTPMYWRWTSLLGSSFAEVAELIDVCWLEIHGKITACMLSLDTTYAAYLVFKLATGAYGFDYHPAEVSVQISGGASETHTVYLIPFGGHRHKYRRRGIGFFNRHLTRVLMQQDTVPRESSAQYPKERADGWIEIELGTYENNGGQDEVLDMSLMEVKGGNWKCGLIVQGIEIRPKEHSSRDRDQA